MQKKSILIFLVMLMGLTFTSAFNFENNDVNIHDGNGKPIGSLSGALNIHDADVHTQIINRHFVDFDSATENPLENISSGNITVLVTDTTGFSIGDHIIIRDFRGDILEHHFDIVDISIDTSIEVGRPIDNNYNTSATLEVVLINMAVSGSPASPIIYEIKPPVDEVWHITRILILITDQSVMDDSKFGGITALTNGVVLRQNNNGTISTITKWKANSDMTEDMFDVVYSDKAPAGFYGLRGRFTFTKAGSIVRLDGNLNQSLQITIQDDMTDLNIFRIKAQGHFEE